MNERHEMVLEMTHTSGAEEWYCPTCQRRMTITWHPWKKIVLESGDIYAAHSASKGGLRLGPLEVAQDNETALPTEAEPLVEDPYLEPWLRWLNSVDSDDLLDSEG